MNLVHFDTVFAFTVVILVLSLLITSLVQIVSAALGLRGRTLFWGIKKILEQTELSPDADAIARKVTTHPAVLSSPAILKGWRRATAIGSDELISILEEPEGAASS